MYGTIMEIDKDIPKRIITQINESLKLVNKNLIQLYWDIGKEICERQHRYGWGKAVVEDLSMELREAFLSRTVFSARNLWRMRNFYVTFEENEKDVTWSRGNCPEAGRT